MQTQKLTLAETVPIPVQPLKMTPQMAIRALGSMVHDTKTIQDFLKGLPASEVVNYKSDLRIIIVAAQRILEKSTQLLIDAGGEVG